MTSSVQARQPAPATRLPAPHVQQALAAVQAKAAPPPPRLQPLPPIAPRVQVPVAKSPGLHAERRPVAPPVPAVPRVGTAPRPASPIVQPALRPAAIKTVAPPPLPAVRSTSPVPVVQPARARRRKKRELLGVPAVDEDTQTLVNQMIDSESIGEEDLILSTRGTRGRFDVVSSRPMLFWRGDSRSPAKVLTTGFSSRLERELRGSGLNDPSSIIWRSSQDDIVNESAVCVARDVRGSMFFPLETSASIYLYAVAMDSYVDTRRAQMLAESVETGVRQKDRRKWRRRSRYRYDQSQTIAQGEEGGAVWQFGEVATYEVAAEHIVGAWRVDREMISGGSSSMSGIRFRIRSGNLIQQDFTDSALVTLKRQAEGLISPYKDWYPRKGKYLSYQGIVSEETPDETDGPRRSRSDVFSRAPKPRNKKPRKDRPKPQGRGRQSHR